MTDKEILEFRSSLADLSIEELDKKKLEIDDAISKMILDSDLMIKAAIITGLITQKREAK